MATKVTAARFIEIALCKPTGPLSHSYTNKKVKCFIKDESLSLLSEFPNLKLFVAPFSYDHGVTFDSLQAIIDGNIAPAKSSLNLITATGVLNLSSGPIYISIWFHPASPIICPIVYLFAPSGNSIFHPCVDPNTGVTTTPYALMWDHERHRRSSTLVGLVRNLINIFKYWPPFHGQFQPSLLFDVKVSSSPTKREAIDRLGMHLVHDMNEFNKRFADAMANDMMVQSTFKNRAMVSSNLLSQLIDEKIALESRVERMKEECEKVAYWMERYKMPELKEGSPEEAFVVGDDKGDGDMSMVLVDNKAVDDAIDDTMRMMEEAVGEKKVELDVYLKQVRAMAKEQFKHRSVVMAINGEPRLLLTS